MAFNGPTNNLERPRGLRDVLAPRLDQNRSGFQGAHIIGNIFWLRSVTWLTGLGFLDNQDTLNNGVLLPESARGLIFVSALTPAHSLIACFIQGRGKGVFTVIPARSLTLSPMRKVVTAIL